MLADNQVTEINRRMSAGSAEVYQKTSHLFKYSQNKRGIESRITVIPIHYYFRFYGAVINQVELVAILLFGVKVSVVPNWNRVTV